MNLWHANFARYQKSEGTGGGVRCNTRRYAQNPFKTAWTCYVPLYSVNFLIKELKSHTMLVNAFGWFTAQQACGWQARSRQ